MAEDLGAAVEAAARAIHAAGCARHVHDTIHCGVGGYWRNREGETARLAVETAAPLLCAQARAEVAEEIARAIEDRGGDYDADEWEEAVNAFHDAAVIAREHAAPRES